MLEIFKEMEKEFESLNNEVNKIIEKYTKEE